MSRGGRLSAVAMPRVARSQTALMNCTMKTERQELVRMIANDNLGIDALEPTGKMTADFRVISVDDIARALETAYDAGVIAGFHLHRAP